MVPAAATVTMAGVFRGQFPQAIGQMSQAGFHPMYNAAFMYNIPTQYPAAAVQGQALQQMPGGGFVAATPAVAFPFNPQFQVGELGLGQVTITLCLLFDLKYSCLLYADR